MDENNVIFQNIQFIYLQYPILSTIFLIHLLFRLIYPRPNRLKVDIGAITKKSKIIPLSRHKEGIRLLLLVDVDF